MQSNIKLGRICGIEIGLNYSWFLIAALIVFSLADQFRQSNPNWSQSVVWSSALLTAVLFFVSLLLHELAHSLVAQIRGLKVKSITLFALGGVSQIEEDATDAKTEFWVAVVGPVTSLIIGLICLSAAMGLRWQPPAHHQSGAVGVLVWLGLINIALALFNLIPAFPLDGGRILRSIIWAITKNGDRSTRIAAGAGQLIAILFILDGIWRCFSGDVLGGVWIVFIGWFLLDAAKASYAQAGLMAGLRGLRVSDIMTHDCIVVNSEMSLQEFVDNYLLQTAERCFAVEGQGPLVGLMAPRQDRMVGIITPRDVGKIPRELWGSTTIRDAMRPLSTLHVVSPDTSALDALKIISRKNVNQLPVVANGLLQGVVSRSQLVKLVEIRSQLQLPATYRPALQHDRKGHVA